MLHLFRVIVGLTIEGRIVGILHVKEVFRKGDPDYPNDPYATGAYTHAIDFIPIPEYITGEHKKGQVNYMSLSEDTKEKLIPIIIEWKN